ncbi:MAG: hypothetical protein WC208_15825 [Gallionella sp.]|jgi:hypothetical protein
MPISVTQLTTILLTDNTFKQHVVSSNPIITLETLGSPHTRPSHFEPAPYGQFISYLTRHRFSAMNGIEAVDTRVEDVVEFYSKGQCDGGGLDQNPTIVSLVRSYMVYMKPDTSTSDIVPDIYNTSIGHSLWFGRSDTFRDTNLPSTHFLSDDMLEDIFDYVASFSGKGFLINPDLSNETVSGDANLIVNDELIAIKTYVTEVGSELTDFYSLYVYAVLYFEKYGRKLQKLTIYNPLLSYTRSVGCGEFEVGVVGKWLGELCL